MHEEARVGAHRQLLRLYGDNLQDVKPKVLDLGGQDINGTVHDLLPYAEWTVLDSFPADGVDIIADATNFRFPREVFDLVVCTEVLEHVKDWPMVLRCARSAARQLVLTCASTGRYPHGAYGDPSPGPDEHYANIDPIRLMTEISFLYDNVGIEYQRYPGDAYCYGWS